MTYMSNTFPASEAPASTDGPGTLNPPSVILHEREVAQRQGEPALTLCEIVEGTVLITRHSRKWGEAVLDILGPGALIGGDGDAVADCSIVATSDVRLRPVSCDALLAQRLSTELVRQRERRAVLSQATALERVAFFLLQIAGMKTRAVPRAQAEDCPLRGQQIHIPVTREEMGGLLGLTIETIARCFAQLRRDHVIAGTHRNRVTVVDPVALVALGGEDAAGCGCY